MEGGSPYENPLFQSLSGGAMRPGGLELTEKALKDAAFPQGARLLDAGCGLGVTAGFLAERGFQVSGVDVPDDLIRKARAAYPAVDFRRGDIASLPWESDYFNGILCECSFSLFANPPQALAEMRRVLAPEGKLLVSDLYRREDGDGRSGGPAGTCLAGARTPEQLAAVMRQAGLSRLLWRDATEHLRQLTARIAWEFGSASVFWDAVLPACPAANAQDEAASKGQKPKFGYFYSVWAAEAAPNGWSGQRGERDES